MIGRLGGSLLAPAVSAGITGLFSRYGVGGLYVPNFAGLGRLWQDNAGATPVTDDADPIGKVADSGPSGVTISQATAGAKPTRRTVSGRNVARFDSGDDLLTDMNPSAAMTIAVAFVATAGGRYVFGSAGASSVNRCYIAVNVTTGQISGGVGDVGFATITGAGSILNTAGVAILRFSGSLVTLWWKPFTGAMDKRFEGAQTGSPNTTIPFRVGSLNENGTATASLAGDVFGLFAIRAAITDAEAAQVGAAFSR